MKTAANNNSSKFDSHSATHAASRVGLLVVLALGLGLAGVGGWYWQQSRSRVAESVEVPASVIVLSEPTAKILAGLSTPVELRLFAPVDVSALPAELGGYVTRVEGLLAEYERVADSKLKVKKSDPQTDASAKSAAGAAGVVPFASENGEIVYLGLTVASGVRIESIFPLAPEWEAALESDVTRAIQRVSAKIAVKTPPAGSEAVQPAPIDPAISEELLRMFPDLASQTFDDAAKILREGALEEFKTAADTMQTKVAVAQKALAVAQANNSEAAQQSALKAFQEVQSEQTDKLKAITAHLQERITVLERLKNAEQQATLAK